jgi:hypothetical protein
MFERLALTDPEGTFVRWSGGLAGRLFTVAAFLFLLGVVQWNRSKLQQRIGKMEEEISRLRAGA